ncbi:MAG: asparagine synthase (glutamine-hydrolyzing) [Anaerolineae bacterium]|nr:asparagine synthase (glutamine-hydrolyzing) [Anaerolineae bacterium]
MCGFTGFFDPSFVLETRSYAQIVKHMSDAIIHRGPDDDGAWVDENKGITLGFRRLAILDLTPAGHQPMASADDRYVMVFNGEIYNFGELHAELVSAGHSFRGTSDTEVMLAAILQWGIKGALTRFNGQFAFALWDRLENQLTLARDRLGVKPLYYGWMNRVLLFGSELKSFKPNPVFSPEINRDALCLYMRHNYIPAPFSIYHKVFKLLPGSYIQIKAEDLNKEITPQPYWSLEATVTNGLTHPFKGNEHEAVDELEDLLKDSIRLRMIADVPLGAFLSGGVDSSAVVALMQTQSSIPVKTFTIGFNEKRFNEALYAREVAKHLHTDHTELYVTPEEAMQVIPLLPTLYDEPFSDSSQIPTFLVSQLARQNVTVSLSGDGGDELFGGYERYFWTRDLLKYKHILSVLPGNLPSKLLTGAASKHFDVFWHALGSNQHGTSTQRLRDRMVKLAEMLGSNAPEATYLTMLSHWKDPNRLVQGGFEPSTVLMDKSGWPSFKNFTDAMMYLDMKSYLPDDILAKVDRASMGVSLEARVPLLDDHRVVEFAWRLPLEYKIKGNISKWILRQVLYRHVPANLIERPKMGFGVPIDGWLRGPLKEWAENLLDEKVLKEQGYLNPAPIRQKWQEHIEGKNNWQYYLWDILMFQSWLINQNK